MSGINTETVSNEMCNEMKERIRNLEESLKGYRDHVKTLEMQIKEYQNEGM